MSSRTAALASVVALVSFSSVAFAQATGSGPMSSDDAAAQAGGGITGDEVSRRQLLLNYGGIEHSVGWRLWAVGVPAPLVGLFVHVEGATPSAGWGGALNVATGPEFVYRSRGMDIVLGLMYAGYGASPGFFRASSDPATDMEMITSNLWALYFTSHFMWGIKVHPMFEVQIGAGLGLGYVGGELRRSQAAPGPGGTGWVDCGSASGPTGAPNPAYCANNPNTHYSSSNYVEASWAGGGSVPLVIPWLSVPHVAFHIRPHRNFDLRLEGGFGVISVYGGASLHYVF